MDLVLTTSCVVVNSLTVHPLSVFSYTDHFAISFDLLSNVLPAVKSTKPCYVFDFCKAEYEGITSFMLDFDFSVILKTSDIEYMWFIIKSSLYEAMSLFVPKIQVKHNHGPKWFNSDIRHHLKSLRTLRRKSKTHPTTQRNQLYGEYSPGKTKATFENNLIESHVVSNSSAIFALFLAKMPFLPRSTWLFPIPT